MTAHVIAVDWSGARGAGQRIALVEVVDGQVTDLALELRREAVVQRLLEAKAADPNLVVGLDFAFSLPAWYLEERSLSSAPALWGMAADEGEQWLARCEPPFWGRPGRPRPALREHHRRSEIELPRVGGIGAKSVFQIGGAGAVGTGSIRGMPTLRTLRSCGFNVWPFDPATPPSVVEIYPRLLTGAVNKGSADARRAYLSRARFQRLTDAQREQASASDDAFDALVSALAMWACRDDIVRLPQTDDPVIALEGWIWRPSPSCWRVDEGDANDRTTVRRAPPATPGLEPSVVRHPDPVIRRCQRVLAMVHELHKLGYQRLRIMPGLSPSGGYWWCNVTPVSNILRTHGAMAREFSRGLASYSSGMDTEYFGWPDAGHDTARELAGKFLERFPEIAAAGLGRDWEYAGWYVEMLGHAEHGALPIAYEDTWGAPDPRWLPTSAGEGVRLPMPPGGEAEPGEDQV